MPGVVPLHCARFQKPSDSDSTRQDKPCIGEVELMFSKVYQPFGLIPYHNYRIYDNTKVVNWKSRVPAGVAVRQDHLYFDIRKNRLTHSDQDGI
jgi:hypothetical protein